METPLCAAPGLRKASCNPCTQGLHPLQVAPLNRPTATRAACCTFPMPTSRPYLQPPHPCAPRCRCERATRPQSPSGLRLWPPPAALQASRRLRPWRFPMPRSTLKRSQADAVKAAPALKWASPRRPALTPGTALDQSPGAINRDAACAAAGHPRRRRRVCVLVGMPEIPAATSLPRASRQSRSRVPQTHQW
jgi:hypothetical protein